MPSNDFRISDDDTGLMLIGKTRAQTNPSRHFHDSWEILYIVDGERTFFHSSRTFNIRAGDFLVIRPGVLHRALNRQNEVCELLNIYFSDSASPLFQYLLPVLESCGSRDNPVVRVPEVERFRIAMMVTNIAAELSDQKTGCSQMAWGILYQLLAEIARYSGQTQGSGRNQMNPLIAAVIDWLNVHYRENISLKVTAQTFDMAQSHLSRAFHLATRFTFTEYISTMRVREACRFLLSSDRTVSDIAESCGFGSITQFGRVFKNLTGETPLVWKKRSSIRYSP